MEDNVEETVWFCSYIENVLIFHLSNSKSYGMAMIRRTRSSARNDEDEQPLTIRMVTLSLECTSTLGGKVKEPTDSQMVQSTLEIGKMESNTDVER